ncbi:MAG: hypothetical protein HQL58_00725 [Magnetococcales bacterium]|nr:hypothetical protein [Magnetococcales bacterium]
MLITSGCRPVLLLLVVVVAGLSGCGYHFPGDRPVLLQIDATKPAVALHRAVVEVHGDGAEDRPLLARMLRERLTYRLAASSDNQSGSSHDSGASVTIRLAMRRVERTLQVEEKKRSTNQYRVVMRAVPTLLIDGKPTSSKPLPEVRGWATYYAMPAATSNQANQQQAEIEAMNQLVDSLVAWLLAPRS